MARIGAAAASAASVTDSVDDDGDASVAAAAFVDIATVVGGGESGLSGEGDEVCSEGRWERNAAETVVVGKTVVVAAVATDIAVVVVNHCSVDGPQVHSRQFVVLSWNACAPLPFSRSAGGLHRRPPSRHGSSLFHSFLFTFQFSSFFVQF